MDAGVLFAATLNAIIAPMVAYAWRDLSGGGELGAPIEVCYKFALTAFGIVSLITVCAPCDTSLPSCTLLDTRCTLRETCLVMRAAHLFSCVSLMRLPALNFAVGQCTYRGALASLACCGSISIKWYSLHYMAAFASDNLADKDLHRCRQRMGCHHTCARLDANG